MKLGQTSVIHFLSTIASAGIGFVSTVYIARMLGAEPFGTYKLVIGVVSWLAIMGKVGLSGAISKRISEGDHQGEYAVAGASIILALFVAVATMVIPFRGILNDYIGYPAASYVVAILFIVLFYSYIGALLDGLHLVHVSGGLSPIKTGGRASAQIALIFLGASTTALFVGHILGFLLVVVIGLYYLSIKRLSFTVPRRRHFSALFDFAKFSWLGNLQSRMFSYTDIVVLGVFVSSGLIGVYAVAWNIAQFLIIFSGTLCSTLFPEMSKISAQENTQAVSRIVEQSLAFGGLFLIPGLFGGLLLGDRILRIYGPEFTRGALVLSILIVGNLFMGYQNQLLNTLNAVDRPDLAFRVNAVFVVTNLVLNVTLISAYGWIGAAIATTATVAVTLALAYRQVSHLIDFEIPVAEILKQWIAAGVMATVVYACLYIENVYRIVGHNFAVVVLLVLLGASVYFTSLVGLSQEMRDTVRRNLPTAISRSI